MISLRKITAPVACIAVICGAAVFWRVHNQKAIERKKLVEAASLSRLRAEQGDARAQFELASMYYKGKGVRQDYGEAARWLGKAADQGYAKAEHALGIAYFYGQGVPQDYAEAARWYRKAADQDYANAEVSLGSMFYYGYGVPLDYSEAARYYRRAADQNDAEAQVALGSIYYYGKGVPQDYSEAIRWYRKAADQGDATAQYVIGYMYDHGKGAPRDHAEAMRWYRKAAKQGDVKARRALREPLSTSMKVLIAIDFLGTMLLLIASYGEARKASGPQQLAAVIKELLSLTYLVLSCASLFHVGIAYTSPFRITRDLLRGMVFAMLIPIVRPQSEKFMLKLSGILFVGFNLYAITHYDLRYSGPAVRIFHLTNALLIGIASASATALWLAAKKDQRITEAQQPGWPTFPQRS